MRASWGIILLLGVSGLYAQPIPTVDKNGTAVEGSKQLVGSPSEYQASKIASSGAAAAVLSYGKVLVPSYVQSYEPNAYSGSYPTAYCHGYAHGYYGNPAHECKIFHVCQDDGRLETFDCPPYTKFNNYLLVCDWPHKVDYNCDPVYKDEAYPVQSHNPAYPVDRSYVPSFMNLYPAPKPAYPTPEYVHEKPVYPVLPLVKSYPIHSYSGKPYAVQYEHEKSYAPVYDVYEKKQQYVPVYPAYPKEDKYQEPYSSHSYDGKYEAKSLHEKAPSYKPAYTDKAAYEHKPAYHSEESVYPVVEKHAPAYPVESPAYSAYPAEKPAYGDYVTEKDYPVVKTVYPPKSYHAEKAVYPVVKPAYSAYPAEKPLYSAYPQEYPVHHHDHHVHEKSVYPAGKSSYTPSYPVTEKQVYHAEKSAYPTYEKSTYPAEKISYSPAYPAIAYEKPAHHHKPAYLAPIYPAEKLYSTIKGYSTYHAEKPSYKVAEYPMDKVDYHEKPYYHQNDYTLENPNYDSYPERSYVQSSPLYSAYPETSYGHKAYETVPATVASYAAAMKSYNDYVSRYEKPSYPAPSYSQYRSRLSNYLRNL